MAGSSVLESSRDFQVLQSFFVAVTTDMRGQEEGWRGPRGDTLMISITHLPGGDLSSLGVDAGTWRWPGAVT